MVITQNRKIVKKRKKISKKLPNPFSALRAEEMGSKRSFRRFAPKRIGQQLLLGASRREIVEKAVESILLRKNGPKTFLSKIVKKSPEGCFFAGSENVRKNYRELL